MTIRSRFRTWGPIVIVCALALVGTMVRTGGSGSVAAGGSCPQATSRGPALQSGQSEQVRLGRALFFSPALSATRTISCGSCHEPDHAFTEAAAVSTGIHGRKGRRNASTILDTGDQPVRLWGGEVDDLDAVARRALTDENEMGLAPHELVERFREVAAGSGMAGAIADEQAGLAAISAFVRSQRAGPSRVERHLYCGDSAALTAEERRGLELFAGRANCVRCHVFEHGSVSPFAGGRAPFTDGRFHDLGIESSDPGRAARTGLADDVGAFRTPSLRNVALTAPYFHDGSQPTLSAVVDFYNRGGGPRRERLDRNIRRLELSETERRELVAFLCSLTSTEYADERFDPARDPDCRTEQAPIRAHHERRLQ